MLERGTWLVPTLTAGDTTDEIAANPQVAEAVREKLRELGRPELEAFRRAADAGVKVAMGTDCPVAPHGTNLRELELMAAIHPRAGAGRLHVERRGADGPGGVLGTLEPGKIADVVVVDGDPFEFATLADRIGQVWKAGVRLV